MNLFIETLNHWGGYFLKLTWPMFWQSSLLIATLFLLDVLFRRHLRAAIRYALWLVVLVKLLLPPTLALPTGAAWWLIPVKPVASPLVARQYHYSVTYDDAFQSLDFTAPSVPLPPPPPPKLEPAGWWLLAAATVSAVLLLWLTFRWWQVRRVVRSAIKADDYSETLLAAVRLAGAPNSGSACLKNHHQCAGSQTGVPGVRLKLVEGQMSPAVCGLFQPVILLPRELAEKLSAEQLRAVLLHELFHLRRGDVWVNCAQALFQIVYWWHPLLWLANARIRRLREEAVDDAVMLALRDKAETYAPTLLEVAKLAFRRPLMSLGLVGIMESRGALRQRIERLVDFHAPRKAGLTILSLIGIFVFSAVALPMGEAPDSPTPPDRADTQLTKQQSLTLKVNPRIFIHNIQAQAAGFLMSPTNDYTVILGDILRSEDVDLSPPNGIAFNAHTGEITTQNTPDKLDIFRQVIQQLNRADGRCELPLQNHFHRWSVILDSRIYQMPAADYEDFVSGLRHYQDGSGGDGWWSVPPQQFDQLISKPRTSGWPLIQRPRIQTGSGSAAEFFVGNGTNNFEFDCAPFVNAAAGVVELTTRGTVTTATTSGGFTNRLDAKVWAENHGGIVLRMPDYAGEDKSDLVVIMNVEIITNSTRFHERLQTVIKRHQRNKETNQTAFSQSGQTVRSFRLFHPIPEHDLKQALMVTGVKFPPTTMFYTHNGVFLVRSTPEQLTLVERTALQLNGFSTNGVDARSIAADRQIAIVGATSNQASLYSRTFKVDPNVFLPALTQASRQIMPESNYSMDSSKDINMAFRGLLSQLGVNWDSPKGKSTFYSDKVGKLFVKATAEDLDMAERVIGALIQPSQPSSSTPEPAPSDAQSATVGVTAADIAPSVQYAGPRRQEIAQKMNSIRLGHVSFKVLPLADVLRDLSWQAKSNDLEKKGINFLINPDRDRSKGLGGSVENNRNAGPLCFITIDPPLTNATLGDILDAVVLGASKPIKYSIQDFAVVFSAVKKLPQPLFSRVFKVDTNTFIPILRGMHGSQTNNVAAMVKSFFSKLGIDLESPKGKWVYYNETRSTLFVKATESDLDAIERTFELLNSVPPQIHIKAWFVEVPKGEVAALGHFSLLRHRSAARITAVLPAAKTQNALHALKSLKDVTFLAEPEVTTTTGRQTRVRATQVQTVITNMSLRQDVLGGNSVQPQTGQVETGPALDLVPYVLSDGYTINLTLTPSLTTFAGYDNTTNTVPAYTKTGEKVDLPQILARTRVRRTVANVNLWDNQTVLLGGLPEKDYVQGKEVAEKSKTSTKELLVFVTAVIVDPAGNRVHSDAALPFAQSSVPSQPLMAVPDFK
jgi:beta-lactamase regulating signal transducer with metallopeptidase domain